MFLCSYLDMLYILYLLTTEACQPNKPWQWYRPRKQATFTSLEKRIFKKALIERVRWVDARIAVDPKQSGPCLCLRWTGAKWLNQHDKAWRLNWEVEKRAYLAPRSNRILLKAGTGAGQGWTGVLMSLKMFLNITRIRQLPKTLPEALLHVCHKAQETVQIRPRHAPCCSVERATEQAEEGK